MMQLATHGGRAVGDVPKPGLRRSRSLRILFLVSAHNGLSQRALIMLRERGHDVSVAVVDSAIAMETAVRERDPELIVCPFLKKLIPESIWSERRCLIVHPGPVGDRGPSSLDWAIELGAREWGATVLEANGEFDAGGVLATRTFPMREVGKSSLYRHEVRRAAVEAIGEAIDAIVAEPGAHPAGRAEAVGCARPLMSQEMRAIDWNSDPTDVVLRKIRGGEGAPGVLDTILGVEFHLFGPHRECELRGDPGEVIARRAGAICRATVDGAVWISHLKRRDAGEGRFFKLPATRALELAGLGRDVPEVAVRVDQPATTTYREISYEEHGAVSYLRFDFYNGAMSTEQCERLHAAYAHARSRKETNVIVLAGGTDYFSTGIHLNVIEAAEDPASESWRNLNAIDDLVRDIVQTETHLVISALGGDAGAGGVPLALAADHVVARGDVVLNPYYQHMGGLYGSEYWTYLLPRRVGAERTARLVGAPFMPVGAGEAMRIGLLDAVFDATLPEFEEHVRDLAERIARDPRLDRRLNQKRRRRAHDEAIKPLAAYRAEELGRSYQCFFGADPSYHEARRRFVYKQPALAPEGAAAMAQSRAAA